MNESVGVLAEEAQGQLKPNQEAQAATVSPEGQTEPWQLVEMMRQQMAEQTNLLRELNQQNGQLVRLLYGLVGDSQKNSDREFGRQGETQEVLFKILDELKQQQRA